MPIFDYKGTLIEDEHDSLLYIYDVIINKNASYLLVYTPDDKAIYRKRVPSNLNIKKEWKIVRPMISNDYYYIFREVFEYHDTYSIEYFYGFK